MLAGSRPDLCGNVLSLRCNRLADQRLSSGISTGACFDEGIFLHSGPGSSKLFQESPQAEILGIDSKNPAPSRESPRNLNRRKHLCLSPINNTTASGRKRRWDGGGRPRSPIGRAAAAAKKGAKEAHKGMAHTGIFPGSSKGPARTHRK